MSRPDDAHVPDGVLEALADGEQVHDERALSHVLSCARCRHRLARATADTSSISALLSAVDHPVPPLAIDSVIARGHRKAHRGVLAAGAIFAVVSTAAAAIPGSPVRRYARHVLATRDATHAVAVQASDAPGTSSQATSSNVQATRGVAFVPGADVDIRFRTTQSTGVLHVRVADVRTLRLSHDSSVAAYALTSAGITVDNAGSSADFDLVIPQSVTRARVRIGTRTVLAKDGAKVTSAGARDASGRYAISLVGDRDTTR